MTPVHNLFIVVEDLLYSNHSVINIVLPYWNKKKEIGPQLVKILRMAGLPRLKTTPEEWVILTDKGIRYIYFTTSVNIYGNNNIVIIP